MKVNYLKITKIASVTAAVILTLISCFFCFDMLWFGQPYNSMAHSTSTICVLFWLYIAFLFGITSEEPSHSCATVNTIIIAFAIIAVLSLTGIWGNVPFMYLFTFAGSGYVDLLSGLLGFDSSFFSELMVIAFTTIVFLAVNVFSRKKARCTSLRSGKNH